METMQEIEKTGLIYRHYDNDIHEFIFTDDGEGGLDHFFEIVKSLLQDAPVDSTLRYIVDIQQSNGQSAMAGLVRRFRKLEAQLGERAAGRTVILHNGLVLLTLANTFLDTLAPSKDKTRFFTITERERAISWLLHE
ncbi:MAG: hypothetical protein AAFV93_08200 [Chloroflexota bacterium]